MCGVDDGIISEGLEEPHTIITYSSSTGVQGLIVEMCGAHVMIFIIAEPCIWTLITIRPHTHILAAGIPNRHLSCPINIRSPIGIIVVIVRANDAARSPCRGITTRATLQVSVCSRICAIHESFAEVPAAGD